MTSKIILVQIEISGYIKKRPKRPWESLFYLEQIIPARPSGQGNLAQKKNLFSC